MIRIQNNFEIKETKIISSYIFNVNIENIVNVINAIITGEENKNLTKGIVKMLSIKPIGNSTTSDRKEHSSLTRDRKEHSIIDITDVNSNYTLFPVERGLFLVKENEENSFIYYTKLDTFICVCEVTSVSDLFFFNYYIELESVTSQRVFPSVTSQRRVFPSVTSQRVFRIIIYYENNNPAIEIQLSDDSNLESLNEKERRVVFLLMKIVFKNYDFSLVKSLKSVENFKYWKRFC
jgi:hypothetical protein